MSELGSDVLMSDIMTAQSTDVPIFGVSQRSMSLPSAANGFGTLPQDERADGGQLSSADLHGRGLSGDSKNAAVKLTFDFSDNSSNESGSLDNVERKVQRHSEILTRSNLYTGLCYDHRMRFHHELEPESSRVEFHPEDPKRIQKIYKEMCDAALVDDPSSAQPLVPHPLVRIAARHATEHEIKLIHDGLHFQDMQGTRGT